MNNIRLFVTDMDGTLFNSRTEVSEENIKALLALYEKGVTLVLASGRMANDVPEPLKGVISYFIESDGGQICDLATGETIYHETVDWRTAAAYVGWLEKDGYFVYIHQGSRFITTNRNCDDRLWRYYPEIRGLGEGQDDLEKYIRKEQICPEKIGTLLCETAAVDRLLARRNDFQGLTMVQTNVMAVEAHSPRTSKGDALRWLAGRLNISADEVAAVGDSDNDITMLRWAGHAYAMENGTAGAKEAAGRVTSSNDRDGVAHAARRYME